MIVRNAGGVVLADVHAVAHFAGDRSVSTVRLHCEPVASDRATRAYLYDMADAMARLSLVPTRRRTRLTA